MNDPTNALLSGYSLSSPTSLVVEKIVGTEKTKKLFSINITVIPVILKYNFSCIIRQRKRIFKKDFRT